MKIKEITASKILSSMGHFTIHVALVLENGVVSSAGIPFGLSAGKYEAQNVPADQAVSQIEKAKEKLLGVDWDQASLDDMLLQLKLAGNASTAVSVAFWKGTEILGKEIKYTKFPKLCMLLFEGGKHGSASITLQEFMLIEDSVGQAALDYQKMRDYLVSQKVESTVGAEGGFSPLGYTNLSALEAIQAVFPNQQIAIDAAGCFQEGNHEYTKILNDFKVYYLEDAYSDEDWDRWVKLCEAYGNDRLIVGDDLTVTNPERLKVAIEKHAINAIIIKPNQNGTITGTLAAVALARKHGLKICVSHRGEETNDDWIADFALYVQADYVKFGGINRGERIAKYNRLLALGMK